MTKNKRLSIKKIVLLAAPIMFFGCYHSFAAPEQPLIQSQKVQEEMVKTLQKLTQYEIDGSFLINQCLDNLTNQALKDKLQPISSDYENNIKELSSLLIKYGGNIPDYSKDFRGYFMSGYAAMRGFTDQGAKSLRH